MPSTAFRLIVPIIKSMPDMDTGELRHHGIASDESLDLEADSISQQLLMKSYPYLSRYGKFNWDHRPEDIGEVLGVEYVTPQQAAERFDTRIEKGGTAVWGTVYPLLEGEDNHQDLVIAHRRFRSRARLGYSLDGIAMRKSTGELDSMFVNRIAITPQPVNANSVCRLITKSISAALEQIGISDEALPEMLQDLPQEPEILIAPGLPQTVENDRVTVSKALFEALGRAAFGPRNAPPSGRLRQALHENGWL